MANRKKLWNKIIQSDKGRSNELLGKGLNVLATQMGSSLTGTSIFDPVLCEILNLWFCPKNGKVLDVFAGGSVRGLVSSFLGNEYTGIDLSKEQIKANNENYHNINDKTNLLGDNLNKPIWICGDSLDLDVLVNDNYFDCIITCPPYVDLEKYSDNQKDLSNMSYDKFLKTYTNIFKKSYIKLKKDAFVCVVVGEVRDKKGFYYNFVGDTINSMLKAGFKYYNECVLLNMVGTGALRAGKQFDSSRKVVKTHQNVLIFVKGEPKNINLEHLDYNINDYIIEEG